MKAITKTPEEVFDKMLEERTKDLSSKLDEISSKISSKPREEKVEDIIRKMKERIPEKIVRHQEPEPVKQEIKPPEKSPEKQPEPIKQEIVHEDVPCPNCTKGHIHKMESSGLTMKCTDGSCGEEYFIIPKDADSTCTNCGIPLKQSIFENKNLDSCPFCKNNKAVPFSNGKPQIKFDFSKMHK